MPRKIRLVAACGLFAATLLFLSCSTDAPASSVANVALGRPYTLDPAPNYGGRTSVRGTVELTDGKAATGAALWLQDLTVGWRNKRSVTVTIDLGAERVLSNVTWHGAAGSAGVRWPMGLYALGSLDGVHYAELGDLVAATGVLARRPPEG